MAARRPDIVWCEDRETLGRAAADRVAAHIARHPRGAVALPTGRTPLELYRELASRAPAQRAEFGKVRWFNLDEYVGLSADHPSSYARFLHRHFLDPAAVPPIRVRLLRGDAPDLDAETQAYDAAIDAADGLDLAILGLGTNGHIAFNEPGADWQARTHVVPLSAETREVHRVQTGDRFVIPTHALTLGIATLRAARRVLLLVAGAKGDALAAWARGVPDPRWPVTSLLGHPDLTLLCEAALARAAPEA